MTQQRLLAALALVFALLAGGVTGAEAQHGTPGSRVLVMPFLVDVDPTAPGAVGASLWLGEAASLVIAEALAAEGVGALPRDDRVVAFRRLNLAMTGALTRATMIRVGELIGASEIVFGEVHLQDALRVRARLIRLDAGRELPAVEGQAPLDGLFGLFADVAKRLTSVTGRVRPATPPMAPMPLEAFENYVKGLVAATPAAEQRFLETAARIAPGDPRVLLALWRVHTTQADPAKALAAASAVPVSSPAYREARFAVAVSLIDLQRYDGAYQALTDLATREQSAAVSNALGIVQLRRGTNLGGQPATTYFKRAVDEEPENTDYLFNLGYSHAQAGRPEEALLWLRECVRVDVADADAHLVMSALLASGGRGVEAQRELELARLLGAEVPDGGLGARLPSGLERLPAESPLASSIRVRAAAAAPAQRDQREVAAFHLANGRALVAAQRDRDAITELRRAIYLAPYEDAPHVLLGQIYQRAGRLPDAIDEFTVAVWSRDSADTRLALADVLAAAGQRDAARTHAERALEMDPRSIQALELLRRLAN